MPVVRIHYPKGALSLERKRTLVASLTDVVLETEVDVATLAGKMVTVIEMCEVGAHDWAVAGVLRSDTESPPDHFIVDVIVLEGLLEGARRADVHRRVTQAFLKAFDEPEDSPMQLRIWVLIHELKEGAWGGAGRTVSALEVAQFLRPDIDQARLDEIARAVGRVDAPP
jgi:phenylpyruvate tautomerase PptA (4-oxalocrotonate tautomerase family)